MWIDEFLSHCKRSGAGPSTIGIYRFVLKSILVNHKLDLKRCSKTGLLKVLDVFTEDYSRSYQNFLAILIKRCLVFLDRKDLAMAVSVPKVGDRAGRIKEKLLSVDEVKRLIGEADNSQDRLLVELLSESGARIGEIYNLRIKDVQFDEYGAILFLSGKSGTRPRRVYYSIPDLKKQINDHPQRSYPEARLFHYGYKHRAGEFHKVTLYNRIRRLGKIILGKNIHPHMFRHTRATEDSKYFTDRELMKLYGWRQPHMIEIYSHLSFRDVEDKDLVLHGLKRKEEILKPLVQVRKCPHCKEDNAPVAMFCHKCSRSLTKQDMSDEELKEWVMKMVREAK